MNYRHDDDHQNYHEDDEVIEVLYLLLATAPKLNDFVVFSDGKLHVF